MGKSRTRRSAERGGTRHRAPPAPAAPAPPGQGRPTRCSCSRSHGERRRTAERSSGVQSSGSGGWAGRISPCRSFPRGAVSRAENRRRIGPVPTGLQNAQPQLSPVAHRPGAPEALSGRRHRASNQVYSASCSVMSSPTETPPCISGNLSIALPPLQTAPPVTTYAQAGPFSEIRRRCSCPGPAAWWCRPWRGRPGPQWSSCTGGSGPAHCRCSALWLRSRQ